MRTVPFWSYRSGKHPVKEVWLTGRPSACQKSPGAGEAGPPGGGPCIESDAWGERIWGSWMRGYERDPSSPKTL